MGDTADQPKRAVHCPQCRRFMFNIVVTAEAPPVGPIAHITDFTCAKCGHKNMVLIGVANKDRRGDAEKVEERLREQMLAEQ